MELLIIVANIFHKFVIEAVSGYSDEVRGQRHFLRYHVHDGFKMDIWDGFTRKPLTCIVSVKRR